MKDKRIKKAIVVILLILLVLGLFRLIYGIWFSKFISKRYGEVLNINESYTTEKGTVVSENQIMFRCEENDISFICYAPLSFSGKYGNLQMFCSDMEHPENEFNVLVPFDLYNYFWGGKSKEFSVRLYYLDESAQRRQVSFKLDGDKNIRNSEDLSNVELELFESMKPRINEIYDLLYEKWPELKK